MDDDLEKLRKIYLADDLDDDERAENEQRISEWAKSLRENSDLAVWQAHDITRRIVKQTREAYKELAMQLATNRTLTEEQRSAIWAKQDAMDWILSLLDTNAQEVVNSLRKEVKQAISKDQR